jgi:hypothetical protein
MFFRSSASTFQVVDANGNPAFSHLLCKEPVVPIRNLLPPYRISPRGSAPDSLLYDGSFGVTIHQLRRTRQSAKQIAGSFWKCMYGNAKPSCRC